MQSGYHLGHAHGAGEEGDADDVDGDMEALMLGAEGAGLEQGGGGGGSSMGGRLGTHKRYIKRTGALDEGTTLTAIMCKLAKMEDRAEQQHVELKDLLLKLARKAGN